MNFKIRSVIDNKGKFLGIIKGDTERSITTLFEEYCHLSQKKCLLCPSFEQLPFKSQCWAEPTEKRKQ